MRSCVDIVVNLPDVIVVLQESPLVGYRQRGAVCNPYLSLSFCEVEHTAEIHCGLGEVQVGEMDLSVQLHHVLLSVSLVLDFKVLESNMEEVSVI